MVQEHKGPGRPRKDGLDERIIAAVLTLIDSDQRITFAKVTELSGVGRAAIYRRWESLTDLIVAALDRGRVDLPLGPDGDLEHQLRTALFGSGATLGSEYPEARFRRRIQIGLGDRKVQQAYWRSHNRRRRAVLAQALHNAVSQGVLRSDLDVEASLDLVIGVFYYQVTVRGDSLSDPATLNRCKAAFDLVWDGMVKRQAGAADLR